MSTANTDLVPLADSYASILVVPHEEIPHEGVFRCRLVKRKGQWLVTFIPSKDEIEGE